MTGDPWPVAETASGRVRGRIADGCQIFLGLPFAATPVGPLRFQAPQPATQWTGVRDCFEYGPTAPQPDRGATLIPEPTSDGDDYLNLNIFTPGRFGDRFPVLVWIHGGGFFGGCNRSPWYRGHRFARDGVVVVSVNYRLGAEGFMPIDGAPANRGALDWLAALRWVRDNIAGFGGDPDNVTIGGQSAGAMGCVLLLGMKAARGLFRRVIAMSGSVGIGTTPENAAAIAERFRAVLATADDVGMLARIPIAQFIAAQTATAGDANARDRSAHAVVERAVRGLAFQPVIDGSLIEQAPLQALTRGAGSEIPVFLSFTAEEFDFLARGAADFASDAELVEALARLDLASDQAAAYRRLHAGLPRVTVLGRAMSDRLFRWRALQMAETRDAASAGTYVAEFRWRPEPPVTEKLGICHCIDIPFAFDLLDAPGVTRLAGGNPPQSLATQWHGAMVDFIKLGNPGWPTYHAARRDTMLVDNELRCERNPHDEELDFWSVSNWARS